MTCLAFFDLMSHARNAHARSDAAIAAFTLTSTPLARDLFAKIQPTGETSGLGEQVALHHPVGGDHVLRGCDVAAFILRLGAAVGKPATTRRIEPYGLAVYQSSIYVVAAAPEVDDPTERLRHWKLDRFRQCWGSREGQNSSCSGAKY